MWRTSCLPKQHRLCKEAQASVLLHSALVSGVFVLLSWLTGVKLNKGSQYIIYSLTKRVFIKTGKSSPLFPNLLMGFTVLAAGFLCMMVIQNITGHKTTYFDIRTSVSEDKKFTFS